MRSKPDHTLDFRSTITPLALLKMGLLIKQMKLHEILEIIVQDPEVSTDVIKVIPGSCCEIIGMESDQQTGVCRIRLEKTGIPAGAD